MTVSRTQDTVAFKVDNAGHAQPKGPKDLKTPFPADTNKVQAEAYEDAVMEAIHNRRD